MTGRLRLAFHGGLATFAAATALGSVYDGYGWIMPVLGGIVVVVVMSELVRLSPLPAALGPLLAAAAVTCYVTAAYAGATAYGHVIPSGDSLHMLGTIARQGFHDVHKLGTPVPTHRGLVLLAVVGIAAVALVVDLLAVTMRRAAVAGLPLLATFALCTSVAKHGAGWVPFVLGTVGYLWLLLADSRDRLSRWGQPLGLQSEGRPHFNWSDQEVMPSPLSVMGRRIGLSAIAIGVIVPLLIPGLRGGIPRGGDGFGLGGHGSSSRFTLNPIVSIRGDLTSTQSHPVMSVRTTDPDPGYLRLTALDRFDGSSFAPSTLVQSPEAQVSRGITAAVPAGQVRVAQVSIGPLDVPWLPAPAQITSVDVPGDWRYDPGSNTVFSARTSTENLQYTVQFVRPHPTPAQLETAIAPDPAMAPYLQLPSIPQSVRAFTSRTILGARTPFDAAVAIQRRLTSPPFEYDLTVTSGDSTTALSDFLLKTHRGFCQQYAAAMAVMARIAGIPSRVAVGFTRGELQSNDTYTVTTHDAHAWPELYFSGYGWLPFEPTPRGDGQAQQPSYSVQQSANGGGANGGIGATGKGGTSGRNGSQPTKNQRLDQAADDLGRAAGTAAAHKTAHETRRDAALGVLVALVMALIAPSLVRIAQHRRRWRNAHSPAERASAAWAELRAAAIDAKAGWIDGLTPRATARVIRAEGSGLDAADVAALDRIVTAVQRAWYAGNAESFGADSLEDDVAGLRTALMADATPGERLVLRLWPRSVLADARVGAGRLLNVLDAMDLAGARLRARLRPRPVA